MTEEVTTPNNQAEETTQTPTPEGSRCPIELQPMADWVGVDDKEKCRPCMLAPLVQWYAEELRQNGKTSMADKLMSEAEEAEPLTLCKELDNIKEQVEEPLRERLKDFDCAAQTFKEEDS